MKDIIVDRNDPVLRKIAKEVLLADIKSTKIKNVIKKMKSALDSQEDGVAIAAPQIGESLRIFLVSKKVFMSETDPDEDAKATDLVCINPVITKISKRKKKMEEGCLSVRWLYGKVERSEKVNITAYDENGNEFKRGSSGLLAQIFQHEIDHLNGILFTDKAEDVIDIPPKDE